MLNVNYVLCAIKGDDDAFVYIMEHCKNRLFRTAYAIVGSRAEAEDCVSETVLKAYQNIRKLESAEYFDTWVTRILINQCNTYRKRQKRMLSMDNMEEFTVSRNKDLLVESVMGMLPFDQRQIVALKVFSGYTFKEIGILLKTSENTIKTKYYKAMKMLEERKEEFYE